MWVLDDGVGPNLYLVPLPCCPSEGKLRAAVDPVGL